jgi:hypothetical protein
MKIPIHLNEIYRAMTSKRNGYLVLILAGQLMVSCLDPFIEKRAHIIDDYYLLKGDERRTSLDPSVSSGTSYEAAKSAVTNIKGKIVEGYH